MPKPSLAAVTPSYNQGEFIERTIRSVLEQDVDDLEYVVMDARSTDETLDVLASFAHDPRFRYVSEKDDGQADAVNKGIAATSNDVICWINSDDIYYPGALAAVQDFFAENPEVDVVYGHGAHIETNDTFIEEYYTEPWSKERLTEVCFLCQPAVFFRRRVVDRLGHLGAQWQYCMDYELWLRYAFGGAVFQFMDRRLAGSRLYADNKTLGARLKVHEEMCDMLRVRLGKTPDRWLLNYAHALLEQPGSPAPGTPEFAAQLVRHSIAASMRWNGTVSPQVLLMTSEWLHGAPAADQIRLTCLGIAREALQPEFVGLCGDGWCGDELQVKLGTGPARRTVDLRAGLPEWYPLETVTLFVSARDEWPPQTVELKRGQSTTISHPLPAWPTALRLVSCAGFRPCDHGLGADDRHLSFLLEHCTVREEGREEPAFEFAPSQ